MEPWYVTGLVEAAGSFTFSRTDRNIIPYFALKLGRDQSGILEDVQAFFGGLGRIYGAPLRTRAGQGASPATRSRYFRVTRIDELDRVTMHFDDYPLRGLKAASYAIWRELVTLKRTGYRRPDRERLDQLCIALSAAAPRRKVSRDTR